MVPPSMSVALAVTIHSTLLALNMPTWGGFGGGGKEGPGAPWQGEGF